MAKLLFITQKVDSEDDVLGIYHRWIEKLSEKVEKINVICLYRGQVNLPQNVAVHSLGKEAGESRIKYVCRFYRYIWNLKDDYDTVFVHMNPIYIILGGIFWKLYSKKIFLWYNHPLGNLSAKVGIFFSNKVFCTSSYAFSAKYKKTVIMSVGIDVALFKPLYNVARQYNRILFLGRISPIKRIELLIEAVKILDSHKIDFELLIIGSAASFKDKEYEVKLKKISAELLSKGKVIFKPSVPYYKTPAIYCSGVIFVNLTSAGSFDKTIIEAMACETLVLASNPALEISFDAELKNLCIFKEKDSADLTKKLSQLLLLPQTEKQIIAQKLSNIAKKQHSLENVAEQLSEQLFL